MGKIRTGNSNIRYPILVSYVAKGLLPYHGLGSGIKRALEQWPDIDFEDDREGCKFTVTVHRKVSGRVNELSSSSIGSPKTEERIIELIRNDASVTSEQLGEKLGISKRAVLKQIGKLKKQGRVRRIGSTRGGHWEAVFDDD